MLYSETESRALAAFYLCTWICVSHPFANSGTSAHQSGSINKMSNCHAIDINGTKKKKTRTRKDDAISPSESLLDVFLYGKHFLVDDPLLTRDLSLCFA